MMFLQMLFMVGPFPSWSLSTEPYEWEAPTPVPDDGNSYSWDEETVQWIRINE